MKFFLYFILFLFLLSFYSGIPDSYFFYFFVSLFSIGVYRLSASSGLFGIFLFYIFWLQLVLPIYYICYLETTWLFNNSTLNSLFNYESIIQFTYLNLAILMIIFGILKYVLPVRLNKENEISLHENSISVYNILFYSNVFLYSVSNQLSFISSGFLIISKLGIYFALINLYRIKILKIGNYRSNKFYLFSLITIIIYFTSGGLKEIFIVLLGIFFIHLYNKKSVNYLYLILGVMFSSIGMVVKMSLRNLIWIDGTTVNDKLSLWDKVINIYYAISETVTLYAYDLFAVSFDFILIRAQYLSWYYVVWFKTPNDIPYQTLNYLNRFVGSFMPKFIYWNKPVDDKGQHFGHLYSLLGDQDTTTSANVPLIADLYIIRGIIGIVIGFFLLFLFLKILRLITDRLNVDNEIFYAFCLFIILPMTDSGTSSFGAYFYSVVIFCLILVVLKNQKNA